METTKHEVPEWEAPTSPSKKSIFRKPVFLAPETMPTALDKETGESPEERATTAKRTFSDRWLPHWYACLGRSRKTVLCSVAGLLLLAIILGLGLGLGLSHKNKSSHKNLPLPSSKEIFNGDLTYYSPGPGYGACGYENTDQDSICAVSHFLWDAVSTSSNPNNNPLCGKMIRITRFNPTKGSNSSVDVKVVDRCTGCKETDLDLSIKMFTTLAEEAQGRVVGSWAWLN